MMQALRIFVHHTACTLACVAIVFFLFVPVSFAAVPTPTTCDCYCATNAGATRYPDDKTKTTRDACVSMCKTKGFAMAACAFTAAQAPDRSPYCYTKDQCKDQSGVLDSKQAWDCVKGQGYCFPNPENAVKVALNVSIPNPTDPSKPLTLTGDIGEYINAIFSFIINTGIIISIIMVMIGGLQYTIGASTKDGVSKGKDRIKNGITGFVLLLCVTLIAQTVNPYLIKLQVPKFPMVKPIGLPEGAASCEQYKLKKDKDGKLLFKMETDFTTGEDCEKSSNVIAYDDKAPAVAAGISCDFKSCPAGKGCLGSGATAKCVECKALTKGNTLGIKPSSSACSQLSPAASGIKDAAIIRCGYTEDSDMITGVAAGAGTVVTGGTCAVITLNFSAVKSCSDYDTQLATNDEKPGGQPLEDIQNTQAGINKGNFGLESICHENPCGLGFPAGSPIVSSLTGMCKYSTGFYNQKDDCVPSKTIKIGGTLYEPGKY